MTPDEKTKIIDELIGPIGQMLSHSKRAPEGQVVFWNGNIFDSSATKLWFGDVNVTKQRNALQKLATRLQERIYVTRESPYRFSPPSVLDLEEGAAEKFCVRVERFDPEVKSS